MQKENDKNSQMNSDKRQQYEFNSITQKTKPENQNQTHNVRKEGSVPRRDI